MLAGPAVCTRRTTPHRSPCTLPACLPHPCPAAAWGRRTMWRPRCCAAPTARRPTPGAWAPSPTYCSRVLGAGKQGLIRPHAAAGQRACRSPPAGHCTSHSAVPLPAAGACPITSAPPLRHPAPPHPWARLPALLGLLGPGHLPPHPQQACGGWQCLHSLRMGLRACGVVRSAGLCSCACFAFVAGCVVPGLCQPPLRVCTAPSLPPPVPPQCSTNLVNLTCPPTGRTLITSPGTKSRRPPRTLCSACSTKTLCGA